MEGISNKKKRKIFVEKTNDDIKKNCRCFSF